MNANARDPFRHARVVGISTRLQAHLNQNARNSVTKAMSELRAASRNVDRAMDQGTIPADDVRQLLRGMAELVTDTERQLALDVEEDNRTVKGA